MRCQKAIFPGQNDVVFIIFITFWRLKTRFIIGQLQTPINLVPTVNILAFKRSFFIFMKNLTYEQKIKKQKATKARNQHFMHHHQSSVTCPVTQELVAKIYLTHSNSIRIKFEKTAKEWQRKMIREKIREQFYQIIENITKL